MIDKFQQIAQSMRVLQVPLLLVGAICLVSVAIILVSAPSAEFERFLTPSLVGVVWSATTCSFIATFCTIPERANKSHKMVGKLKLKFARGWYWFLAVAFLATTVTALILTGRLMSVWLQVYVN